MGVTTNLKLPYPELTDAVDGPSSFDALAQGVEDYFYRRILPAGIARMPSYNWGAGPNFPVGAATGDTFTHMGLGPSLMRWNGAAWRQIETADVASAAIRNAISLSYGSTLLHRSFRVRQADTGDSWRWDGSAWIWAGRDGADAPWARFDCPSISFGNGLGPYVFNAPTGDTSIASYSPASQAIVIAARGNYVVTGTAYSDTPQTGVTGLTLNVGSLGYYDERFRGSGFGGAGQLQAVLMSEPVWLDKDAQISLLNTKYDGTNVQVNYSAWVRIKRVAG